VEIDAYGLSFIAGGFTIVGALIGTLAGYWLATHLERFKERRAACAKLRTAFAPTLGQIYLAQKHGDHDRPSIEDFVKSNLLTHASAIEEFRPFVTSSDRPAYQEAWENYRKLANDSTFSTGEDWATDLPQGSSLERCIVDVLTFAEKF
jgi:hypothetical protein